MQNGTIYEVSSRARGKPVDQSQRAYCVDSRKQKSHQFEAFKSAVCSTVKKPWAYIYLTSLLGGLIVGERLYTAGYFQMKICVSKIFEFLVGQDTVSENVWCITRTPHDETLY